MQSNTFACRNGVVVFFFFFFFFGFDFFISEHQNLFHLTPKMQYFVQVADIEFYFLERTPKEVFSNEATTTFAVHIHEMK